VLTFSIITESFKHNIVNKSVFENIVCIIHVKGRAVALPLLFSGNGLYLHGCTAVHPQGGHAGSGLRSNAEQSRIHQTKKANPFSALQHGGKE